MVVSGVLQNKMITGFASKDKQILEEAGKITIEAISNIRTVALLNKEKFFYNEYSKKIDIPYKYAYIIYFLMIY
jgi:ATP-binding cassette subfamily B (MDR/TAP) protein 11